MTSLLEVFLKNVHIREAGLEIRTIHDDDGFERLRNEWARLYKEINCTEAFLTWEWLFAWWKYYKADNKLWIVIACRNGKLKGIAPLMLTKKRRYGLEFRALVNLGGPDADISGFILQEGDCETAGAIFDYLINYSPYWDLLHFYELPVLGITAQTLVESSRRGGCWILEKTEPHYHLSIETDWKMYFEELPHNLRGYLRHHIEKVVKKGTLRFEIYNGENLKWDHFLTIFEINKQGKFPYLYQSESEYGFIRELFNLAQGQDWIEVDILYFNDTPVAFNYGFSMDGRHEGWRMAYDKAFSKLGVGKILSMHLIESLFNRGFREFDFLRGLEEYKQEWLPREREYAEIRVVPGKRAITAAFFVWFPRLFAWIKNFQAGFAVQSS